LLAGRQPGAFVLTVLIGLILAAGCWWVCTHYSRLWNLTFRITGLHQALCAGAAVLTLIFCICLVSLQYTKQAAQEAIDAWQRQVRTNPAWRRQLKRKIYYMVKATNQEDFSKFPPPEEVAGEPLLPVNKLESKRIYASETANEALRLFRQNNPFLARVLQLPARIPDGVLLTDMNNYFGNTPKGQVKIYPFSHCLDLTSEQIEARLDPELPRVVVTARLILTGCFFVAQAIPFFLIGLAATRDLQIST
jgi:hypothetical protein